MKSSVSQKTLFIVFAFVVVSGLVPRAQADDSSRCSNATLRGSFGYTSLATLLPASGAPAALLGPSAEVGTQTFDGRGNTEASATITNNGTVTVLAIQGTYTVSSDCTGSMTLNVSPIGVTVHLYFTIDDDGLEIRALLTDPIAVESRVYRKQFRFVR